MSTPDSVTLYFDPACPWTWRTSRWLVDAAGSRGVPVTYEAFELANGAPLELIPEQFRAGAAASRPFLRAVTRAHAEGRDEVTAAAYTWYGTKLHDENVAPTADLVREAWSRAGGEDFLETLEDTSQDDAVARARAEAAEKAGDDVGSPILDFHTDNGSRALFGPVVAPTPTGADADSLWDLMLAAVRMPQLFELKTKRTVDP